MFPRANNVATASKIEGVIYKETKGSHKPKHVHNYKMGKNAEGKTVILSKTKIIVK